MEIYGLDPVVFGKITGGLEENGERQDKWFLQWFRLEAMK